MGMIWIAFYCGICWGFALGAAAAHQFDGAKWLSILFAPVIVPYSIVIAFFGE